MKSWAAQGGNENKTQIQLNFMLKFYPHNKFYQVFILLVMIEVSLAVIAQWIPIYSRTTVDFSNFPLETFTLSGFSLNGTQVSKTLRITSMSSSSKQ